MKKVDTYLKKNGIILILLFLAMLPYLYISLFCNPIADDFTYAYKGKNNPFLSSLLAEYLNWNGRYISNVFVLLNPITFDSFIGYKLSPIIIIGLTFISIHYFIRTLTNKVIQNAQIFVFSISITLLYLYQMPNMAEGIYWYTGAVTYQLGNIFFLIHLGSLISFFNRQYIYLSKSLHVSLLIITMFLTIGFNEIMMLITFLFYIGIYIIHILNNLEGKRLIFFLLIVSFGFSCIVYFAPGNSIRESYFPGNHKLLQSFFYSSAQTVRFFFDWISSISLVLMSILYYPLNKELTEKINIFKRSFYLSPFVSLGLLFFVVFIGSFPAYWSTGILGQHRTLNVSYFIFILIWFINLTVIYNWGLISFDLKYKKARFVFQIFIWCSFLFTKNGYKLIDDIRTGSHKKFNSQMEERYAIIIESGDTIFFEPIKDKPSSLFVIDITDNASNWQNRGYSIFFNVPNKSVVLKTKNFEKNDID